ncbi:MAG: hypothetical protein A2494_02550 [Candidatus Lloydbacteria bacterium RIFOXYC12_FULL_46_25]|uniref:Uncharacterized protein n=1 Tax=Candidatus Lloydbacteria bacterium RIFOXYC12_FULL_46_25 TaxID=1798670 RepID=A0A1G2E2I1_9BACT|nr:MAG: hypothetical protein A2494_02550 [Candidatus Lloydbacteria bacterium RIFOXYC12_FULL_46_25]
MKEEHDLGVDFNHEGEGKVVDVHVTSVDGVIQHAPVFEGGSIGSYENSGYETDTIDMPKVLAEIRARYGLPGDREDE